MIAINPCIAAQLLERNRFRYYKELSRLRSKNPQFRRCLHVFADGSEPSVLMLVEETGSLGFEPDVWVSFTGYDDDELWSLLEQNKIHDRFCASECMYLNHIKNKFKTSLMMDPVSCNIMGFHYLGKNDLAGYIERRIELDNSLKIGIINESSEVLPVPQ